MPPPTQGLILGALEAALCAAPKAGKVEPFPTLLGQGSLQQLWDLGPARSRPGGTTPAWTC